MRFALLIFFIGLLWGCSSDDGPVTPGPPVDGMDTVPPDVVGTSPADGATGVNVNADIFCTFTEPVDVSSLARWSFYLSDDVAGVFTFDCATNTACFNPGTNLAYCKTYSATITRGVTDTAGNPLVAECHWSFSTTTPPQVIAVWPQNGDSDVALNTVVWATFDRAMDPATISNLSFKLDYETTGTVVYADQKAELLAHNGLESNRTYTAALTTLMTDSAGNPLEAAYKWSFSTIKVPLIPLAVGNRWSYFVEKWDTAGQLTAQYYDTMMIDHTEIIDNETWFVDNDNRRYAVKDDGLWRTGIFDHRYLQAKFPADIGDQYPGDPGWNLFGLQEQITVIETKIETITDAGTFICYQYRTWIEGRHRYNYYYAPGVGLVKYEVFRNYAKNDWPVLIERWSLVSHNLAGPVAIP